MPEGLHINPDPGLRRGRLYHRWRSKYGGLMPLEMKRLNVLEEENVRLKRLAANLSLGSVDKMVR